MKFLKNNSEILRDEQGAVAIITAVILAFVLFGTAALAIDIGRLATVKNELQNAADAAALAKARHLYPQNNGEPNWLAAEQAPVPINTAGGVELTEYEAEVGYWNLSGSPPNIQSSATSDNDVPAVQVTVERSEDNNSGPITNFFGGLIGLSNSDVVAEAIAVTYPPGEIGPGQTFPVAIHQEFLNLYHDNGLGEFVVVSSAYHSEDPEEAGQWTSLFSEANDRPTTRDLILNGNPDKISKGDEIYIQPGTMTSLYNDTESWLQDSPTVDEYGVPYRDVIMPVVKGDIDNKSTKEWREVVGFVGIRITYAAGGNEKIIEGKFNHKYAGGGSGGAPGEYFEVSTIPALVK